MIVFGCFVSVAMILNLTIYPVLLEKGTGTDFNMFYISPYLNNVLPVLSEIQPRVPYPIYLCIYIIGFTLVAALVYAIEKGIVALTLRKKNRAQDQIPN